MSDARNQTSERPSPGCRTREAVFAAIDAATDESAPGRTIDTDRFFESLACSGYLVQWAGAIGYRNMADTRHQTWAQTRVTYDADGDVLYINLCDPPAAADHGMEDENGVLRRYRGTELIGITIVGFGRDSCHDRKPEPDEEADALGAKDMSDTTPNQTAAEYIGRVRLRGRWVICSCGRRLDYQIGSIVWNSRGKDRGEHLCGSCGGRKAAQEILESLRNRVEEYKKAPLA